MATRRVKITLNPVVEEFFDYAGKRVLRFQHELTTKKEIIVEEKQIAECR
ncbi:hypothetical protein ABEY24_15775 [Peribacillus frigoritolerans]